MNPTLGSDSDRIQAIHQLELAIAAKRPALDAACAQRNAARESVSQRSKALQAVETRTAAIGQEVHFKGSGIYLNGQSLDQATVLIGNESLWVRAWHGQITIPLYAIRHIQIGASFLAPRAGIPFVSRLFPGRPRPRQTLILVVQPTSSKERRLAVLADLTDADLWAQRITRAQEALTGVAALRADLLGERNEAANALTAVQSALARAQSALDPVEREVSALQTQMNVLRRQQVEMELARERARQTELEALKAKGRKK